MIAKDCTERPAAVALSVGRIIPRTNAFRVTWSERVRHRNVLTEIAWEDSVQGLGMTMFTAVSEKNREMLFIGTCLTNSDVSGCCFTSVSRARPPENCKY